MITYIVRRLLQGILVLIIVTVFVFLIMRLLPGDPLSLYVAQSQMENISPEEMDILKDQYGLNKSLPLQYIDWIGGILQGDLGNSIFMKENVNTLFAQRLPVTLHLGILSMIISAIFGITFGVICALRRGKWIDTVLTLLANVGITAPSFWVGIILIYFLSLKLKLLPLYGYTSPFTDFWLSTRQLVLPVFCLSIFSIASLTRQTRSSTLEVVRQDYVRTAWAKGLRERVVVMRHIVKNSLIPVVTILGMQMGFIFGGSVLIETVFNIQGIGRLLRDAAFSHDYPIVQGGVLIISSVVVLSNLIVDISYGWFDPRIRYD
ncbi:MAG: ABC transporter permease [Dehalococcoidales bacterium]|nr:ABC transporter permease [Dehalococcoidales bacterium]